MSETYPFVDLRPALQFTRRYWCALSAQERDESERLAAWSHVRIEIIDEPDPPSS